LTDQIVGELTTSQITTVERIVDEAAARRLGIQEGALYLLGGVSSRFFGLSTLLMLLVTTVHTGSRGLGASILKDQTKTESNPYIPYDSPQLRIYLAEHDYAVQWARANRDLVAYRVKECLSLVSKPDQSGVPQPSHLGKIVDVTHNSVTQHRFAIDNESKDLWLHRKGAAPSTNGIAPCPGSRGHFSWLLEPTGDGQFNGEILLT
jgi:release factor H-coupled RctB family protein